jgi:ferredoxin
MNYKFRPVNDIFKNTDYASSGDDIETRLFTLAKKGGVGYRDKEGVHTFALIPLVVGMYEGYLEELTPEFLKDFRKYSGSLSFGYSFLATSKVQMRTIPVEESITPEHRVSQFDEIVHLLEKSEGPFVAVSCICRKVKRMDGETCKATDRDETCLVVNHLAKGVVRAGIGKSLSKQEAIGLIKQNTEDGLVLQPSNTKNIDFICSCCGCCCGMLGIHKMLLNPADYWATNFFAVIDEDACTGCGICAQKCQVDAIGFKKNKGRKNSITVNLKKCIGCGNCVVACKFDGIHLKKKEYESIPPVSHDDLYEAIMEGKKSKWKTIKNVAKIVLGIPKQNDR